MSLTRPSPLDDPAARETVQRLVRDLGVRPVIAALLARRGVDSADGARRFLEPRLLHLRAPEVEGARMAGFGAAADRLADAVQSGERIGVFGDYDADGVTTAALLATFLREAGARVYPRAARRDDGYGFQVAMADHFADAGCPLLVTCDCGTSDHAALARARARGVEVIVVDHHQVPEREPDALSLINPHQARCAFPFKGLASVGVGFYLAAALRGRLRARGHDRVPEPRALLDLVALGTVADLVPLVDENRVLVRAGLGQLAATRRPGLRALLELQGLVPAEGGAARPLTAFDVGFRIAPLLNAPGRLGDAQLALDLLLEVDEARAAALAAECFETNGRRREVQGRVLDEAYAQVEGGTAPASQHAIVVAAEGWHHGVVGIVAAKLVERYDRPAIVIALAGGRGRGSARAPAAAGLHLYQGLAACADLLDRFGGHAAAAGLSLAGDRVAEFARRFDEVAGAAARSRDTGARGRGHPVDESVALAEIDERLVEELALLGPFGMGNPEPTLWLDDVLVEHSRIVGVEHLQITLRQGLEEREGIAFRQAARDPGRGARVHVACVPEIDHYRGGRRLRLRVLHLEPLEGGAAP